ncbi:MAG: acyl-ACP--UDP-N-acetylglucosamine O-acyltransferase [Gammaproteobacteria bacterium]
MIHATAIVSPEASLDATVTVGPYTIIEKGVRVGAGTVIGPHCVLKGRTTVGENNQIFQFCSIGEAPQDKKYAGEDTSLEIGDGNTIREYCTLNRGTAQDKGVTRLGNNNWLMAYVHIAHDCIVGDETIFANNVTLAGHVTVDDYVIWGGFSGAHQFVRVGAHAFIANNAAITRDVPPYLMASGRPASPRGINIEGLKRRGFDSVQTRNIKNAFRLLYRSGLRLEEAREKIAELAQQQPELTIFATFLEPSERSILR